MRSRAQKSHNIRNPICDVTNYSRLHLWCHKLVTSAPVSSTKKITFAFVSSQIRHKSRVRSRETLSSRKKTWLKREFFFSTWVFCEFYSRKSHVFVTSVPKRKIWWKCQLFISFVMVPADNWSPHGIHHWKFRDSSRHSHHSLVPRTWFLIYSCLVRGFITHSCHHHSLVPCTWYHFWRSHGYLVAALF